MRKDPIDVFCSFILSFGHLSHSHLLSYVRSSVESHRSFVSIARRELLGVNSREQFVVGLRQRCGSDLEGSWNVSTEI
jgi:hypothetical protein